MSTLVWGVSKKLNRYINNLVVQLIELVQVQRVFGCIYGARYSIIVSLLFYLSFRIQYLMS